MTTQRLSSSATRMIQRTKREQRCTVSPDAAVVESDLGHVKVKELRI